MNNEQEKHNEDEMEIRLWAYLDGQSEETSDIEDLLRENNVWKEKYGELLELQTMFNQAELEQPSLRFTKNVMEGIAKYSVTPAVKTYINKNIVWSIAAFFLVVIGSMLAYALSQASWSGGSGTLGRAATDIGAVDYSKMFNNTFLNGFMTLNVILGLFLLDRFLTMKKRRTKASGWKPDS